MAVPLLLVRAGNSDVAQPLLVTDRWRMVSPNTRESVPPTPRPRRFAHRRLIEDRQIRSTCRERSAYEVLRGGPSGDRWQTDHPTGERAARSSELGLHARADVLHEGDVAGLGDEMKVVDSNARSPSRSCRPQVFTHAPHNSMLTHAAPTCDARGLARRERDPDAGDHDDLTFLDGLPKLGGRFCRGQISPRVQACTARLQISRCAADREWGVGPGRSFSVVVCGT